LVLAALTTGAMVVGYSLGSAAITAPLHLITLIGTTWCVAYLMAISQRPAQTMIAWAWQGYDQARRHLAAARDRQVELKQALEDLDLANREVLRLNDLLAAAREALEEARRAKEEFVANVSHELRTPLNMIIGFSNEIMERPDLYSQSLPGELLEDIVTINRNSRQLAHLVDDVLDLVSTPEEQGKPTGHDMLEGVYTLPVIRALAGDRGDALRPLLTDHMSGDDLTAAVAIVRDGGWIDGAIAIARGHTRDALGALDALPRGTGIDGLTAAAAHLVDSVEAAAAV